MNQLAPNILRYQSLPSTNTEAARLALAGAAEGLCVVAEEQTAGRGRLGREWISPKGGGLYCSIILRPTLPQERWPVLTLMVALAVQQALLEACNLETDIKWPNDILADGGKLGGILAETVEGTDSRCVVVGIGVNLTSVAIPPELQTTATSVQSATGGNPDCEALLDALLGALIRRYSALQSSGSHERIVTEWSKRSSYAYAKSVRVSTDGGFIEGITRGLESDGALRVETGPGEISVIRAGEVTSLRPVNN